MDESTARRIAERFLAEQNAEWGQPVDGAPGVLLVLPDTCHRVADGWLFDIAFGPPEKAKDLKVGGAPGLYGIR